MFLCIVYAYMAPFHFFKFGAANECEMNATEKEREKITANEKIQANNNPDENEIPN